jgi:PIN domain nuclease of toxin-antitoxin system
MSKVNEVVSKIAKNVLDIETLETRKSDSLDFHDVAVWELKKALRMAYLEGILEGKNISNPY